MIWYFTYLYINKSSTNPDSQGRSSLTLLEIWNTSNTFSRNFLNYLLACPSIIAFFSSRNAIICFISITWMIQPLSTIFFRTSITLMSLRLGVIFSCWNRDFMKSHIWRYASNCAWLSCLRWIILSTWTCLMLSTSIFTFLCSSMRAGSSCAAPSWLSSRASAQFDSWVEV